MKNQKNTDETVHVDSTELHLTSAEGQYETVRYGRKLTPLLNILEGCKVKLYYSFRVHPKFRDNRDVLDWVAKCSREIDEHNESLDKAPTTRPAQAESITAPEKAKSDKLGLGLVMIPFYSIYRIGKIFIEGLRYGRDNWKKGMNDKEWQEERLEHAINHLFLYKEGDQSEDHLAKVAWFCLVQMELTRLEQLPCYDAPEKDKARCQMPDGEPLLPEIRRARSLEDVYEQLQMAIHKIDKLSEQDLPKIF
jgi:hypothetical protein